MPCCSLPVPALLLQPGCNLTCESIIHAPQFRLFSVVHPVYHTECHSLGRAKRTQRVITDVSTPMGSPPVETPVPIPLWPKLGHRPHPVLVDAVSQSLRSRTRAQKGAALRAHGRPWQAFLSVIVTPTSACAVAAAAAAAVAHWLTAPEPSK